MIFPDFPRPLLFLAPMAGYTESAFRRMIKETEPSVILTSELISAECLRQKNKKTMDMLFFDISEKHYFGVQLFGNESGAFIAAAQEVEKLNADFIDLNLGCPSPKIKGSGYGSALLKDIDSTAKLIEALVKNTNLPVTVKMRLGFYNPDDLLDAVKKFEKAGAKLITIHGRTAIQKFSGKADWSPIYQIKEEVEIPVVGNGDILSATQACKKINNLDGIMIGRGAIKNPWIFSQCRAIFSKGEAVKEITLDEHLHFLLRQTKLMLQYKLEPWALIELRKYFIQIFKHLNIDSVYINQIKAVASYSEFENIVRKILNYL